MLNRSLLTATTIALGLIGLPGHASIVLLDDNFNDGNNPGYSAPGGGAAVSVTSDPFASGFTTNTLLLSTTSNNRTTVRSLDQAVTLTNNGDFVELSSQMRLVSTLDDSFGFEVGFTGSAIGGVRFNPTAAGNGGTYYTVPDTNAGRFNTLNLGTDIADIVVRITREDATTVRLTASFNGTAVSDSNAELIGTDISIPLTFDGISLGWVSGNKGDVYFDNVSVITNVPEPGSLALLGLGAAACVVRRRG